VGLSRHDSRDKRDYFDLALTLAKINPKDNMIRLVCLKRKKYGGEWRYVKVPPSLIEELLDYVRRNKIGSGERIFPYTRRWVLELVKRYAEKAGVTISPPEERKYGRIPHPHLFRHSYAINLARQMRRPEELAILQRRLGHKTLNSTGIYLTRLPDSLPAPDFWGDGHPQTQTLPDEEKERRLLRVLETCRWLHNRFTNLDEKVNYHKLCAQLRELRKERRELREVNHLILRSVLSRVVREARNGGVKPVEEYRSFSFTLPGTGYLKFLRKGERFHLVLPRLGFMPFVGDPTGLGLDLKRCGCSLFFTTNKVKRVEIGREGDGWWVTLWLRGESPPKPPKTPNPETPDPPEYLLRMMLCSGKSPSLSPLF